MENRSTSFLIALTGTSSVLLMICVLLLVLAEKESGQVKADIKAEKPRIKEQITEERPERPVPERLPNQTMVTGLVKRVSRTGFHENVFWDVPEGRTTVSLSDDLSQDVAKVICILCENRGTALRVGDRCYVYGKSRGRLRISGVPIMVDCVVVDE